MKDKKVIIGIGITVIFVIVMIGILSIININSRKRISETVITNMENSTDITKEYLDRNITKVSKETATQMVNLYEKHQDSSIDKLYNEFKTQLLNYQGSYDIDSLNNIENITDENLKNILLQIRNNGYKFKEIWGDIIVVKDYSQFEEYTKYVSEDKKTYIEAQNEYEKQLYSYENIDSLLNAIIKLEKDINKINDSDIKKDMCGIYTNMILLIIEGDEIYVPKEYGKEENNSIITAINTCIASNPNTVTANILTKYINALTADEYEYKQETIELKDDITNNINSYFNIK